MDITITGRNTEIPDRFRAYAEEKALAKVTLLSERAQHLEIKLKRRTDRMGNILDRGKVEITLFGAGPVVRAEAEAGDKYAAFDLALDKLSERLRRDKDRRKVHRGLHRPESLTEAAAEAFASVDVVPATTEVLESVNGTAKPAPATPESSATAQETTEEDREYNPVVIREKLFPAKVLTKEEAVDHMELLGHDFFLFVEAGTNRPSVVYRRQGWDYGVIGLEAAEETAKA